MAYNSSHTGAQIDEAVGKVIEKEATWDGKQGKLTGKKGQIVGFDADGHAVAQDAPTKGMTEAEADAKYLPLAGGEMTGPITLGDNTKLVVCSNYNGGANKINMTGDRFAIVNTAAPSSAEINSQVLVQTRNMVSKGGDPYEGVGHLGLKVEVIERGFRGTGVTNAETLSFDLNGGLTTHVIYPSDERMPTPKSYVDKLKTKAHRVSLTVAGWNSSTKQQTVAVGDVVADETAQLILPMPAAASMTAYNDAGIQCTAQAAGKLTFTADTVPTAIIDVYVTVTPVAFS